VRADEKEMAKISGVLIHDMGTGGSRASGYSVGMIFVKCWIEWLSRAGMW
jgi:hypothetical protein